MLRQVIKNKIVSGSLGSLVVNVLNVALSVAASVVLARILGAKGFGVYTYVLTLSSMMLIVAQFGLPVLLVRETAINEQVKEWGLLRGLWRWSIWFSVGVAAALIAVSVLFLLLYHDKLSSLQITTFLWGLLLVLARALASQRGAVLRGLRFVVQGQLPDNVLRYTLLIIFIGVAGLLIKRIDAAYAMALHVCAAFISFGVGSYLLWLQKPKKLHDKPEPEYDRSAWINSAWPLMLVASMQIINTQIDVVMLGLLGSAEEVGVYRVAAQGAMLVAFGLTALGMVAMPYLARLYNERKIQEFGRLATLLARASLLLSLPIILVFIMLGKGILEFVFGHEFSSGYSVLVILGLAKVLSPLFGLTGSLLNMAGYERDTAKGLLLAVISNLILNSILIPLYGMNGAAVATGITVFIWSVVLWAFVRKRINIDASVF